MPERITVPLTNNPLNRLFLDSVQLGYSNIINAFLDNGADVNTRNRDGESPLHLAILLHRTSLVELLLNNGADINATTCEGISPLHWAAVNNRSEIVELLIARGADPRARDLDGRTPLEWAEGGGHKAIAAILRHVLERQSQTAGPERRPATFSTSPPNR